ncbi:MAG TPA: pseudouridine synthase, partial [Nocardioidaceae bacterium]
MFGLSRTKAAELVAAGDVTLDGVRPAKSDRVEEGAFLEVLIPAPDPGVRVRPEVVAGLRIMYDDQSFVVVDKPVGVAAHPSVGWTGPTVLGHLAGAGFRIATSGVPERQGIVQRLDVGTSGLMVVAKSEYAYSRLKRA